jgi:hypothetical protein
VAAANVATTKLHAALTWKAPDEEPVGVAEAPAPLPVADPLPARVELAEPETEDALPVAFALNTRTEPISKYA